MAPSGTSVAILAAAGSAVLLAAASSRLFGDSKSSDESSSDRGGVGGAGVDIDDLDDLDAATSSVEECITAEDVVKIFDTLFMHMQSVLAQLSQQIQQLQMAGQSIPEKQLKQLLKGEFERALQGIQPRVFEENDVDESCLEEATWEFLDKEDEYPQVKKAVERFQKLYENVSGEKVVGIRPGDDKSRAVVAGGGDAKKTEEALSQEKLLEAAEVYFNALTTAMGDIVKSFKQSGKNLTDPSVAQRLHMEFASVANEAGESALGKMGVSLDGFRAAIEKYSGSPEVGRTLTMLQMKQQQELMAMGVPAM